MHLSAGSHLSGTASGRRDPCRHIEIRKCVAQPCLFLFRGHSTSAPPATFSCMISEPANILGRTFSRFGTYRLRFGGMKVMWPRWRTLKRSPVLHPRNLRARDVSSSKRRTAITLQLASNPHDARPLKSAVNSTAFAPRSVRLAIV